MPWNDKLRPGPKRVSRVQLGPRGSWDTLGDRLLCNMPTAFVVSFWGHSCVTSSLSSTIVILKSLAVPLLTFPFKKPEHRTKFPHFGEPLFVGLVNMLHVSNPVGPLEGLVSSWFRQAVHSFHSFHRGPWTNEFTFDRFLLEIPSCELNSAQTCFLLD